ncbi:MAG: hypothetical protein CL842_05525 [Crocinitomicaceae bacterium]|nr:hypothetical protein [Crocinitomicaceae bacterium]
MFKNDNKLAMFMSRARENQVYVGNRRMRIGETLSIDHINYEIQSFNDAIIHHMYYNGFELCSIQQHTDELEHIKDLLLQARSKRGCKMYGISCI